MGRMIDQELADTNETLSQQTCTNQAIQGAKSKCEAEMNNLGHDLDEMTSEAKMSEDKAQRSMIDAARLAEELRAEQEVAMMLERDKKLLEAQVKDAQTRLDEAEQTPSREARRPLPRWRLASVSLSLSLTQRTDVLEMLPRTCASLSVTSRS